MNMKLKLTKHTPAVLLAGLFAIAASPAFAEIKLETKKAGGGCVGIESNELFRDQGSNGHNAVLVSDCSAADTWTYENEVLKSGDRCLDLVFQPANPTFQMTYPAPKESNTIGFQVVGYGKCLGIDRQRWIRDGERLKSAWTEYGDLCLDVQGSGNIHAFRCSAKDNQRWNLVEQ